MIYLANDTNSYLRHYGVLGMKWGHHRYSHYENKVNKLSNKRKVQRVTKGADSGAYRRTSKNLYIAKGKRDLAKAQLNNDHVGKTVSKQQIKEGKYVKKWGASTWNTDSKGRASIFGSNLTPNEKTAILIREEKKTNSKTKHDNVKRIGGAILTSAAITAGSYYVSKLITSGKLGTTFNRMKNGAYSNPVQKIKKTVRDYKWNKMLDNDPKLSQIYRN